MTEETKKSRGMSVNGFLAKSVKPNLSASGFLSAHRDYMLTGELAPILAPIVAKIDEAKEIALSVKSDTEAVARAGVGIISRAVMDHIVKSDIAKHEARLSRPAKVAVIKVAKERTPKNWIATVFDSKDVVQTRINDDGEEEELIKGFDMSGDADKWLDRRLALDGASDWYGVIEHTHSSVRVNVLRQDSIHRIFRSKKGPASHQKGTSTKSLGFGVKCGNDVAKFSRG